MDDELRNALPGAPGILDRLGRHHWLSLLPGANRAPGVSLLPSAAYPTSGPRRRDHGGQGGLQAFSTAAGVDTPLTHRVRHEAV